MQLEVDPIIASRVHRQIDRLGQMFARSVRPVFGPDRRANAEPVGSAVLLRVNDASFLLTAAHVLDKFRDRALYIGGAPDLVEVKGERWSTPLPPSGRREDDPFDVGVVLLSADVTARLSGCCFVPTNLSDPDDRPSRQIGVPTIYVFLGYPASREKPRWRSFSLPDAPMAFANFAASHDVFERASLLEETHAIVRFNEHHTYEGTERTQPPKVSGMSGGAVWSLGRGLSAPAADFRLIGIVIERRTTPDRVFVGTRIALFLEAIRFKWPLLSSAIPKSSTLKINVRIAGPETGAM